MSAILSAWMAQNASAAQAVPPTGQMVSGGQADAAGADSASQSVVGNIQGQVASSAGQGRSKGAADGSSVEAGLAALLSVAKGDAAQVQLPQAAPPTGGAQQADGPPASATASASDAAGADPGAALSSAIAASNAAKASDTAQALEAGASRRQTASAEGQPTTESLHNPAGELLQAAGEAAQYSAGGPADKKQANAGQAARTLITGGQAGEYQVAARRLAKTQASADGAPLAAQQTLQDRASNGGAAGRGQASNQAAVFQGAQASVDQAQGDAPTASAPLTASERASAASTLPDKSSEQTILQALGVGASQAPVDHSAPAAASSGAQGAAQVLDQIAQAVHSSAGRDGKQVVIQLNPPDLGNVRMTVRSDPDGVRCSLQVDSAHTFQQIQHEAPALASRLAEGGVHFKGIEITMREPGSSSSSNSMLQDGQAGRNPTQNQGQTPWQQNNRAAQDSSSQQAQTPSQIQTQADPAAAWAARPGDGAVNVWR
jgi:flagellar hook-length control protein FliK